ncbi:imidazolonepropionase-like amidohydrolase [Sedimentibacter acidaminivorans]|uniref:Imidazolonepropionase-like amidohydrolase n=1 Tax=Sedimentibacter acidaminivorans TaxID=913099 RepID=A0ABS4GES0_9FIRM|nr:amidohydrolase [Sedimentibacter acidaminivorans]MBP1926195.1 imidazolonepropionase-like amidohydrolase [Sedimentibacter acidaminivorans]
MILIKNGYVKTMAGDDIKNGQILIEGGVIKAVGMDIEVPDDVEIIDAKGCLVTPGLVEGHCHIGMWEEGIGFEGEDGNEDVEPITPQLRAIDAINPMDMAFQDALEGGVTTVVTGPGSANVIGGQFLAMKTFGKRVDNMVIKDPVAMKIAFGENPKRVYDEQHKSPVTRMAIAALLRETLFEALQYKEDLDASETDPDRRPDFDIKLDALIPVMRKEIPLKAHVHRADDIFTALRIAKEFELDITLEHCTEGHLIVDELAEEGKSCLVGPTLGSRAKYELRNISFDTPKILVSKGIKIAIITDAGVIPIQYLSMCAGLAVKAGLSEQEAWKAITINPAEIIGIADRVGSIEEGKDADIVIFKGNPLTDLGYETVMTMIEGQVVYKNSKTAY